MIKDLAVNEQELRTKIAYLSNVMPALKVIIKNAKKEVMFEALFDPVNETYPFKRLFNFLNYNYCASKDKKSINKSSKYIVEIIMYYKIRPILQLENIMIYRKEYLRDADEIEFN